MITRQDLHQEYRAEFGHYPNIQEYCDWLEERILRHMNRHKTVFDRQMEIINIGKKQ
jgi:hypothetical protein